MLSMGVGWKIPCFTDTNLGIRPLCDKSEPSNHGSPESPWDQRTYHQGIYTEPDNLEVLNHHGDIMKSALIESRTYSHRSIGSS